MTHLKESSQRRKTGAFWRSNYDGFSYIELIISVAIMALLATAATPYLENTIKRQKEVELRRNLRDIRTAIDAYKKAYDDGKIVKEMGASGYPKKLEVLVEGITDATDPQHKKIRFMRQLPSDPMFEGTTDDPASTWGKRAYDSDPSSPREGSDVYDIYSLSEQKGLNGIPYKKW